MFSWLIDFQELNLITVDDNRFIANFDSTFDLGNLDTVKLKLNNDVRQKIVFSRDITLALQSKVKQELDNLAKRNIIYVYGRGTTPEDAEKITKLIC